MKIRYLGQEGFSVSYKDTVILTDPYLSYYVDNHSEVKDFVWKRAYPPVCKGGDFKKVDYIFISHAHDDHCDPETVKEISERFPKAIFVISLSLVSFLSGFGVKKENIIGVECFKKYTFGDLSFVPIPSAHEILHETKKNVFDEIGYVFYFGNNSIYHAGDCCIYNGIEENLKNAMKDSLYRVCLLPVNGIDEKRRSVGIIGNMNENEASALAGGIPCDLFIPMHHDLYIENGVSNERIIESAEKACVTDKLRILAPGEEITIND